MKDQYKKEKEQRKQTANIRFMLTEIEKKNFKSKAVKDKELNESDILRILVAGYVDGTIKIK